MKRHNRVDLKNLVDEDIIPFWKEITVLDVIYFGHGLT
jgi:hypothetical protein